MGFLVLVVLAVVGLLVILPLVGNLVSLAITLVVWAVIGWAAGKILRGRGFGALGNILLGLGGGILGGFLFGLLGWSNIPFGTLVSGIAGAIVLVYLVRALGLNPRLGR